MEEINTNPSVQNSNVGFPGVTQTTPPQSNKNWKWLIVLILFLVVIGGVTFFVFKSSRSTSTLEESPTPNTSSLTNLATPEPTNTPSSSPSDKTQVKIKVLNGTGISGEAGLLSDKLKSLGYTNLTTGNASKQIATDTQVTFSQNVAQDVIAEITSTLKGMYTNVTTSNSTLSDTDIQITTGLRKGQTPAPAATSTPQASNSHLHLCHRRQFLHFNNQSRGISLC